MNKAESNKYIQTNAFTQQSFIKPTCYNFAYMSLFTSLLRLPYFPGNLFAKK